MMDRLGIRESIYTKIIINAQALVAKYRCVVIGGLLFVGLGIHKIFVLNRSGGRNAFKPATYGPRSAYINHHT